MKRRIQLSIKLMVVVILAALYCRLELPNNQFNPDDPDYMLPELTFDSLSFSAGDTIAPDTVRIAVRGNFDENIFRWRMEIAADTGKWSEWRGAGDSTYAIIIPLLSAGNKALHVQTAYHPNGDITDSLLTFYIARKPSFDPVIDSLVRIGTAESCTLRVNASGTPTLKYTWYKDSLMLDSAGGDSQMVVAAAIGDAGVYTCRVVSRWGSAESGKIRVIVVPLYSVFYEGNGSVDGNVPVEGKRYEKGSSLTVLGNSGTLVKTGYSFANWNTATDSTGKEYSPGSKLTIDTMDVVLYAQWTLNRYQVTFDTHGGSSVAGQTVDYGGTASQPADPSKPTETFTGWFRDSSGTQPWVFTRDTITNDVTIYAGWTTRPTFSVTYSGNGSIDGSVPAGAVNYEVGGTVVVLGNLGKLARAGHTFTCWNTAENGAGKDYAGGETFEIDSADVILFAKWTPNQYTITFDPRGGSAVEPQKVLYGRTIPAPGAPTLAGQTLIGWFRDSMFTRQWLFTRDTVTDDMLLFAKWTTSPTFTVAYDGNGKDSGAVPTDAGNYEAGMMVTVAGNGGCLIHTGFTFTGWNTAADGSGTSRDTGSTFSIGTENVTLYAQWSINRHTVDYSGNDNTDGTVPPAATYNYGSTVTVADNSGKLVRTGCTFVGWNTRSDGNGTNHAPGSMFAMGDSDVTLFAKWLADQPVRLYTVHFFPNGGSAVDSQSVAEGDTVRKPADPQKPGYDFSGWFRELECVNPWVFASDTVVGDDTLFAKWTIRQYTVNFDARGGVPAPQAIKVDHGGTAATPATPEKPDSTFVDWFKEMACVNVWSFATDTVTGELTLYAKWEVKRYTVTFDSKGGSVVPVLNNVAHGSTIAAPTEPNRNGYSFGGWFTEAECTNQWVFASNAVVGNTTLFAKWTIRQYTVEFNSQEGNPAVTTLKVDHGKKATPPAAPIKSDSNFVNWYKEAACVNPWVFASDTVVGDVTLYAKWEIKRYTVVFNSQGGSPETTMVVVNHGSKTTSPAMPTKSDSIFAGWFREAGCVNAWVFARDSVVADTVLYGKWRSTTTVVDIDGNIYNTVTIGTQTWLVENLKVTRLNDGTAIPNVTDNTGWSNLMAPGYCWYDNLASRKEPYGALYNWYTVGTGKLAPEGWHAATDEDWAILLSTAGGAVKAGGKLKEKGIKHWVAENRGATDEFGFTALPGGCRFASGTYSYLYYTGIFGSSTDVDEESMHNYGMYHADTSVSLGQVLKQVGLAVRCVQGVVYTIRFNSRGGGYTAMKTATTGSGLSEPLPPVRNGFTFGGWFRDTTWTSPWVFASDVVNSDDTLFAKWRCMVEFNSQGGTPELTTATVDIGANLTAPNIPTKTDSSFAGWYREAACVNAWVFASDTVAQNMVLYAKWQGADVVVDIDGNVYHTVTIGTQVWMVENLKTTTYNDGEKIPFIEKDTVWATASTPAYCWYDNDSITNKPIYGALYNWFAVGTGKLAPTGWHVPTPADWNVLVNFLGGADGAGGKMKEAGLTHWIAPNEGATNEYGFGALPGGSRSASNSSYYGRFFLKGQHGNFWSSTESYGMPDYCGVTYYDAMAQVGTQDQKKYGFSIRCLRDY